MLFTPLENYRFSNREKCLLLGELRKHDTLKSQALARQQIIVFGAIFGVRRLDGALLLW